jgi:hypothetical protein
LRFRFSPRSSYSGAFSSVIAFILASNSLELPENSLE